MDRIKAIATLSGRAQDLRLTKSVSSHISEIAQNASLVPAVLPTLELPAFPRLKTPVPARPALERSMRSVFGPSTPEERSDRENRGRRSRAVTSVIGDFESLLARYAILLNGDDNSSMFDVAPILNRNLRLLYFELETEHPQIEAQIYTLGGNREVYQLRAVVEKANALMSRFHQLLDALGSGDIIVGYITDSSSSPTSAIRVTSSFCRRSRRSMESSSRRAGSRSWSSPGAGASSTAPHFSSTPDAFGVICLSRFGASKPRTNRVRTPISDPCGLGRCPSSSASPTRPWTQGQVNARNPSASCAWSFANRSSEDPIAARSKAWCRGAISRALTPIAVHPVRC
jgi:hypothetical protein